MRHTGARTLIVGSALLSAAGFLWQSRIETGSGYLDGMLGPGVTMSAGMGLLITPITTTVTSGILTQDAGAASGLMNATRQIGGALGLAALVTVAATTWARPPPTGQCSWPSPSCARALPPWRWRCPPHTAKTSGDQKASQRFIKWRISKG